MTSDGDYELPSMSRREAMSAGSAAAVAVGSGLLAQSLIGAAAAQTQEPRISLGPDWTIDDDPDGSGHFVIEHTPNGNEYRFRDDGRLVLSEADIGQLAAALDANGQDITGVGELATDENNVNNVVARAELTSNQTISTGTTTKMNLDSQDSQDDAATAEVDLANNQIVIKTAGVYRVKGSARWAPGGFSAGDRIRTWINVPGNERDRQNEPHDGNGENITQKANSVIRIEQSDLDAICSVNMFHNAGQDETIDAFGTVTHLEVSKLA